MWSLLFWVTADVYFWVPEWYQVWLGAVYNTLINSTINYKYNLQIMAETGRIGLRLSNNTMIMRTGSGYWWVNDVLVGSFLTMVASQRLSARWFIFYWFKKVVLVSYINAISYLLLSFHIFGITNHFRYSTKKITSSKLIRKIFGECCLCQLGYSVKYVLLSRLSLSYTHTHTLTYTLAHPHTHTQTHTHTLSLPLSLSLSLTFYRKPTSQYERSFCGYKK